jgi:hypothetical protein
MNAAMHSVPHVFIRGKRSFLPPRTLAYAGACAAVGFGAAPPPQEFFVGFGGVAAKNNKTLGNV